MPSALTSLHSASSRLVLALPVTHNSRGALTNRFPSLPRRAVVWRMRSLICSCLSSSCSDDEMDRTSWPCLAESRPWFPDAIGVERFLASSFSFVSRSRVVLILSRWSGRGEAGRFAGRELIRRTRLREVKQVDARDLALSSCSGCSG